MRTNEPLDQFALDVLRAGATAFTAELEQKLRHAGERFGNGGHQLPYMLLLVGTDRELDLFDVFMVANIPPHQAKLFLLQMLAKVESGAPILAEHET